MLGVASMLGGLDDIAAARDLAQLDQHHNTAHMVLSWVQDEAETAAAVNERDQRLAMP